MRQSSLISHAALSTGGVLAQGLARFAVTALIGRFMGPADLATVSASLALALVLSLLWPTGAGNAASLLLAAARARGEDHVAVLRVLTSSFWVSCAILMALSAPIVLLVLDGGWSDVPAVAALVLTYSGYVFARGVQVGRGAIAAAAVWDLISASVTIALLVAVLVADASALLLWPITIGYGVFLARVLTTTRAPRAVGATLDPRERRRLVEVTGWNSLGLLASNGLIHFSMLFVFALQPATSSGLFAAAMSLATPASMLSQAVSQVLLARFSHTVAQSGAAHCRREYLRVLALMATLLLVVFALVALVAPILVDVVFGRGYGGAVALMQLLLAGVLAFSVTLVAGSYLIATGQVVRLTAASIAGLVAGIAVMSAAVAFGVTASSAAGSGVVAGYAVSLVVAVASSLPTAPARTPDRDVVVPL